MKKGVLVGCVLILCISFVYAIKIPTVSEEVSKEVLEDRDRTEEGTTTYFYAGSKLIASQDDSGIKYYHQDRLGNNRKVTGASGTEIASFKSLPYGQEIENTGVKYSFTGKELEESDLYNFGARYYDSNLGRFTSVDPVEDEPAYAYVHNNPMNLVDPDGGLAIGADGSALSESTRDYRWTNPGFTVSFEVGDQGGLMSTTSRFFPKDREVSNTRIFSSVDYTRFIGRFGNWRLKATGVGSLGWGLNTDTAIVGNENTNEEYSFGPTGRFTLGYEGQWFNTDFTGTGGLLKVWEGGRESTDPMTVSLPPTSRFDNFFSASLAVSKGPLSVYNTRTGDGDNIFGAKVRIPGYGKFSQFGVGGSTASNGDYSKWNFGVKALMNNGVGVTLGISDIFNSNSEFQNDLDLNFGISYDF